MPEAFIVSTAVSTSATEMAGLPAELSRNTIAEAAGRPKSAQKAIECLFWGTVPADSLELESGWAGGNRWPVVAVNAGSCSGQEAVHLAAQGILTGDLNGAVAGGISCPSHRDNAGLGRLVCASKDWMKAQKIEPAELDRFVDAFVKRADSIHSGGEPPREIPLSQGYAAETAEIASIIAGEDPSGVRSEYFVPRAQSAAALTLVSAGVVGSLNLAPRGRLAGRSLSAATGGLVWDGIWKATEGALSRAGITAADLSCVTVDTDFWGVTLTWLRGFDIAEDRLLAAQKSPARMGGAVGLVQVLDELDRTQAQYGLVLTAGLDGLAAAAVVERY